MSDKKLVVSEGMLKAALNKVAGRNFDDGSGPHGPKFVKDTLEAALFWLRDELQKMTQDDPYENLLRSESMGEYDRRVGFNLAIKKVIHMFLVPEPEIPEEIKDLWEKAPMGGSAQEAILEAYHRGTMRGVDPSMLKPGCLMPGKYVIGNIKAPK